MNVGLINELTQILFRKIENVRDTRQAVYFLSAAYNLTEVWILEKDKFYGVALRTSRCILLPHKLSERPEYLDKSFYRLTARLR